MKASDLLIGAAIVAVGVIVYRATRPPAATPPASSSSSAIGAVLTPIGATLATRLSEALDGERDWW